MKLNDLVKLKTARDNNNIAKIVCVRKEKNETYYDVCLVGNGKIISGLRVEHLEEIKV